jgi:phosphonate metabolism-associated iron-containing alcohol dehydrogenase
LIPNYYSPTRMIFDGDLLENLEKAIAGRRWSVVTSAYWCEQNLPDKLKSRLGAPNNFVGDVPSNPTEFYLIGLPVNDIGEVVVAIGGGSVMDAAKTLAALEALNDKKHLLLEHLRTGSPFPDDLIVAPVICVPTTSGTGSEVTRWATIWGENKIKYSLTDPKLYPEFAVLSPELCVSMPEELTLSSGLDAVSHAMEAVWNRNHTPLSDQMARRALTILRKNLGRCLRQGDNLEARAQVQIAATLAGLAMSITQTALCHSISYPFTALFGMPHGLACSFTLGAVSRFNLVEDADRLLPIADGLSIEAIDDLPDAIEDWFGELELGRILRKYASLQQLDSLDENLITRSRAKNNIRDVGGAMAKELAKQGIRMCLN